MNEIKLVGRNLYIGTDQQYYLSQESVNGIKAYIQLIIGAEAMKEALF